MLLGAVLQSNWSVGTHDAAAETIAAAVMSLFAAELQRPPELNRKTLE